MNTHCIIVGIAGWTSNIADLLTREGLEVEYLPKLNALLVYNTTKGRIRRTIEPVYGGGKIVEFEA